MNARTLTALMGGSVVALLALAVRAEQVPRVVGGDARIRELEYDPRQVVRLEGVVGYHLHLELEPGEQFVNLGAGDSAGLEIGAEGNHVMLKPREVAVATNLTLLSNRRVYFIEYSARGRMRGGPEVYSVRFRYAPAVVAAVEAPPSPPVRITVENREYWACGAAELRPVEVFDDGVRTHLRFAARSEWPAIFVAGEDGSEGLVNLHAEGDVAVVHRVVRRLVLRRGGRVACVENRAFAGGGTRLPTGTVSDEVERVTRGVAP